MKESQCKGKTGFESIKLAEAVAKNGSRADRRINVYKCPYCRLFHVGNKTHRKTMRQANHMDYRDKLIKRVDQEIQKAIRRKDYTAWQD